MITEKDMNRYIDKLKQECEDEIERNKRDHVVEEIDDSDPENPVKVRSYTLNNYIDGDVFTALAQWLRIKNDFENQRIKESVIEPETQEQEEPEDKDGDPF